MKKYIKVITIFLVTLFTGSAFGIPQSVLDQYIASKKSEIVGLIEATVKPNVAFYKKGDKKEPVAVIYVLGYSNTPDRWNYKVFAVSENDFEFHAPTGMNTGVYEFRLEYIALHSGGRKITESTNFAYWSNKGKPIGNYTLWEVYGWSGTNVPIEYVYFFHAPRLRDEVTGSAIPVTDRYDAVCLDICPWLKPKVEAPKVEIPKIDVSKVDSPPILKKTVRPNTPGFVYDPVYSVNEKKLDELIRRQKLRNIFRKRPNKPITNWYDWVQENLEIEPK